MTQDGRLHATLKPTPVEDPTTGEFKIALSCHTFLNVYPTRLTYGRNATLKKDLCDGLHAKDDKAPFRNCFDENISRQRLSSLRSDCTGLSSCSQEVPTIVLDPVCDGLRREQRVEYICGETKVSN